MNFTWGLSPSSQSRSNSGRNGWIRPELAAAAELTEGALTLRIASINSAASGGAELTRLELDGVSVLGDVVNPLSPQMATTMDPGRVTGSSTTVSRLIAPLEEGATYLVSYSIIEASEDADIWTGPGAGGAFASETLPTSPGVHNLLLSVTNPEGTRLFRMSGDITFGYLSCRKAEWHYALPEHIAHPERAETVDPGRVTGSSATVSHLTETLEEGATYLVSYSIIAASDDPIIWTGPGGGGAFEAEELPVSPGVHNLFLRVTNPEGTRLFRMSGDITFGHLSCRKADWPYTLPQGAYPELAVTERPGQITGTDQIVSALNAPLEPGVAYILRYHVTAAKGAVSLSTRADAGSPFATTALPHSIGHHAVTLVAESDATAAIAHATGDLSIGYFSCRRAGGTAGRQIKSVIRTGNASAETVLYTPDPGAFYVAPDGDDLEGTGARATPFRTPAHAASFAQPGDTIYLRPGTYAPFVVEVSGTKGNPITFTTLPGEEHQAIVEGDLMDHVYYGGPGGIEGSAMRDAILIPSRDYIHIRNLTIQNTWRGGIYARGTLGEQHGHHVFANNVIRRVGASAIRIGSLWGSEKIPPTQTENLPTDDVIIEYNDISETNVPSDFGGTNSSGVVGGNVECISVTNGASNVITRYNDIHDSRQFGVNYKTGVSGGAIYGNRIWNMLRYGIYIDSAEAFVENVDIYDNLIWNCRAGITLAREPHPNVQVDYVQALRDIRIWNNTIWNIGRYGIFLHRHDFDDAVHPDTGAPVGEVSRISVRFNTIYNTNRWADRDDISLNRWWEEPEYVDEGVISDFDFIGNIIWNDTATATSAGGFTGGPEFAYEDNLLAVDPLFVDTAGFDHYGTPPFHPHELSLPAAPVLGGALVLPDLRLQPGSPAIGLVGPARAQAPFDLDAEGEDRSAQPAAGAWHRT